MMRKRRYRKSKTKVQAIIFDKKFWTVKRAKQWLNDHNYEPLKPVDITKNFYRFRITWPTNRYNYRIITFGDGIKAIIMYLKKK